MSTDFLTRLHMDPTRNPNPVDSEDRHVPPTSPYDKESMFEKPLTPSDVGKLNRLVIPKQYAEKYFPLGGAGDVAGTLLGFEDESGKGWNFRYSYWNSSQSYVLTKGWSRYVKDKGLHAGDVVVFERHRSDPERLFIGWRRRGVPPAFLRLSPYQAQRQRHGNGGREAEVTTHAAIDTNNSTRLVRLFGVNLECQLSDDTTSSHPSSQPVLTRQQEAYRNYFNYLGLPPNHLHLHQNMDMHSDGKSTAWMMNH